MAKLYFHPQLPKQTPLWSLHMTQPLAARWQRAAIRAQSDIEPNKSTAVFGGGFTRTGIWLDVVSK